MKAARICGSLRRKFTASCSLCDFGCPLSCHNCSQEEFWYFCTTLLATLSNNGCCCALATPAKSSIGRDARTTRFSFDLTFHISCFSLILNLAYSPLDQTLALRK